MGLYTKYIFPTLCDFAMSRGIYDRYRREILAHVHGDILEIGFGTGINIGFYPEHIKKITTIDSNPRMGHLAKNRIKSFPVAVFHRTLDSQNLPMEDHTFDSVVSTWTLCSIKNVDQALHEIRRVLKPEGKLFFLEHGLSKDKKVRTVQNYLTPVWKCFAGGCHLNRDIKTLLARQGFRLLRLKEFYVEDTPKFAGYMYQGVAVLKKRWQVTNNSFPFLDV